MTENSSTAPIGDGQDGGRLRVVMPVHNAATYVLEAITSVLDDLPAGGELVIVDDGSTDGSGEIARAYALRDARVTVIRHDSPVGVSRALNAGIKHAGCPDFVAVAEHDDVVVRGRFSAHVDALRADAGLGAVSGEGRYLGPSGRVAGRVAVGPSSRREFEELREAGREILIPHPAITYRRDAVVDSGLYDAAFDAAQDLELAGAGAFSGSGSALTRSATEGELMRGRGSLAAGLRDQGFQTAANLSNLDAQRAQQTDLANLEALFQRGNLAMGAEASDRANLGTMMSIGDTMRGIDAQQRNAPISLASVLAGLQGSMPYSLLHGQEQTGSSTTTSKTSDPMGALGSLAMLAAAPLTGGTSLLGMGMQGLGALGGASKGIPYA